MLLAVTYELFITLQQNIRNHEQGVRLSSPAQPKLPNLGIQCPECPQGQEALPDDLMGTLQDRALIPDENDEALHFL